MRVEVHKHSHVYSTHTHTGKPECEDVNEILALLVACYTLNDDSVMHLQLAIPHHIIES